MRSVHSMRSMNLLTEGSSAHAAPPQSVFPLNPMEPRQLFTAKIAMSHITLYYYSGGCLVMLSHV